MHPLRISNFRNCLPSSLPPFHLAGVSEASTTSLQTASPILGFFYPFFLIESSKSSAYSPFPPQTPRSHLHSSSVGDVGPKTRVMRGALMRGSPQKKWQFIRLSASNFRLYSVCSFLRVPLHRRRSSSPLIGQLIKESSSCPRTPVQFGLTIPGRLSDPTSNISKHCSIP